MDYYRGSRKDIIKELTKKAELNALTEGLALKASRVAVLKALAAKLAEDIFGESYWLDDVKAIGSGKHFEKVFTERFNDPLVMQLRGVLDDLAKEMGERKQKVEHTGKDGKDLLTAITVNVVKSREASGDGSQD